MILWYFSSSVNSHSSNAHAQPSSAARCLIFSRTLRLLPYSMCANSEGSGETARMRRLAWAFAGRLCDKYHNLMSWLNYMSVWHSKSLEKTQKEWFSKGSADATVAPYTCELLDGMTDHLVHTNVLKFTFIISLIIEFLPSDIPSTSCFLT